MEIEISGLLLNSNNDWREIDEDDNNVPPTLARNDGFGVIQFTSAIYQSGEKPYISIYDLQNLFEYFCEKKSLNIDGMALNDSISMCFGGVDFSDDTTGVWYLSDGMNVALVTYAGPNGHNPIVKLEVQQAQAIARTVRFASR